MSSDPSEGYRFDTNPIVVREGKGHKDRLTRLPVIVKAPLLSHLERVRTQYQQDLECGFGRVYLPDARRRKYPTIEREWGWKWAFPASRVSLDPRSGGQRRPNLAVNRTRKRWCFVLLLASSVSLITLGDV